MYVGVSALQNADNFTDVILQLDEKYCCAKESLYLYC